MNASRSHTDGEHHEGDTAKVAAPQPLKRYLQDLDDDGKSGYRPGVRRPCAGHHAVVVGDDGAPIKVVREDGTETCTYIALPEPRQGVSLAVVLVLVIVALCVGLVFGHKIGIAHTLTAVGR